MRRNLVSESQPFGRVMESKEHVGMNGPAGSKNALGATTERFNSGVDQTQSFDNKAPNAREIASANAGNPFHWSGRPKK